VRDRASFRFLLRNLEVSTGYTRLLLFVKLLLLHVCFCICNFMLAEVLDPTSYILLSLPVNLSCFLSLTTERTVGCCLFKFSHPPSGHNSTPVILFSSISRNSLAKVQ
jgi:hypothetical protein